MKKYTQVADAVWKILAYALSAMMAALVVIAFWQILCRYVFRSSNGWTQEISTLLFVWTTFLGGVLAIRSGSQIAMKVLVNRFPDRLRYFLTLLSAIVCEMFYFLLSFAGIKAIQLFMNTKTPALRISMAVPYGAIAFAGIAMLFFGIDEIAKPVKDYMQLSKGQKEGE